MYADSRRNAVLPIDADTETILLDQQNYIDPMSYNSALPDLTREILETDIDYTLDANYLEYTDETETADYNNKTIYGTLYGQYCRPLINLVISSAECGHKLCNVIFFVDFSSPYTYLSKAAAEKLGFQTKTFDIIFNNRKFSANLSHERTTNGTATTIKDVNIIGQNFLSNNYGLVKMDYMQMKFSIQFQ